MFLEGEKKTVEYKLEYSKTILKTVCAFTNFHDAIIPKPYYEFEMRSVEELKLLIVKVNKGDHTPYTYQNKAYMRRDTSTVQVDATKNQNLILAGRNLSFEDLVSSEQNLTFDYFNLLMKKHLQITSMSDDLLKILGLIEGNKYNNAAMLLSDENHLKSSVVQLVAFSDTTVNRIKDKITLDSCSLLQQFDECMSFYKKHINIGEIIESVYRKTVEVVCLLVKIHFEGAQMTKKSFTLILILTLLFSIMIGCSQVVETEVAETKIKNSFSNDLAMKGKMKANCFF